jgi:hypothetical protein
MNIAKKRLWYSFGISAATLVISAVVSAYVRLNGIPIGIFATIPLISMVALSVLFPGKEYDERDLLIEGKANPIGIVGAFGFLTGAGFFLPTFTKMAIPIVWLIYFAYFVLIMIGSVASLIQYGFNRKESCDGGE